MHLRIHYAKQTGGKAGKGHEKTRSLHVVDEDTNCVVKQYRYKVKDGERDDVSFRKALAKCRKWIQNNERI